MPFLRFSAVVLLVCFSTAASAQEFDWPAIIFRDTTNFNALRIFDHPLPVQYRLLKKTAAWNSWRLSVQEDITNPEVRKRLEETEHHPYHSYIFRAPELDSLVPVAERNYLLVASQKLRETTILPHPSYQLIDSARNVPSGFYFSLTRPIFSIDHAFVFIDMNIFLQQEPEAGETFDEVFNYYAIVLLVYHYSKEKGWTKFFQSDRVIL